MKANHQHHGLISLITLLIHFDFSINFLIYQFFFSILHLIYIYCSQVLQPQSTKHLIIFVFLPILILYFQFQIREDLNFIILFPIKCIKLIIYLLFLVSFSKNYLMKLINSINLLFSLVILDINEVYIFDHYFLIITDYNLIKVRLIELSSVHSYL